MNFSAALSKFKDPFWRFILVSFTSCCRLASKLDLNLELLEQRSDVLAIKHTHSLLI